MIRTYEIRILVNQQVLHFLHVTRVFQVGGFSWGIDNNKNTQIPHTLGVYLNLQSPHRAQKFGPHWDIWTLKTYQKKRKDVPNLKTWRDFFPVNFPDQKLLRGVCLRHVLFGWGIALRMYPKRKKTGQINDGVRLFNIFFLHLMLVSSGGICSSSNILDFTLNLLNMICLLSTIRWTSPVRSSDFGTHISISSISLSLSFSKNTEKKSQARRNSATAIPLKFYCSTRMAAGEALILSF